MQEFQKLAQNKLVVGFATGNSKRPLIVMPAQGEKDLTRTTIRHEYGHVLLHYKDFAYPAWFEEGFAELVSSTKIVNKALQLFGGYGYLRDYPIERFWRDLRVHSILEGTNQVMRMIVGRDLLRQ